MSILIPNKKYDPHMGMLIKHMEYTRIKTIKLVNGLTIDQLDFNLDEFSNSIGTLLSHISAFEFYSQRILFFNRHLTSEEFQKYKFSLAGNMDKRMVNNNDIDYYLNELAEKRNNTLKIITELNDNWLFKEKKLKKLKLNNLYILRHLIDDEISHQGQIKWIIRRIKKNG